ncbi:MAG: DUF721 domain-containing protein [Candidatus Omnitrophota bacterium]|nr:DUF721 domain-containing protein [Candidatus Omnitrophota bacterium]
MDNSGGRKNERPLEELLGKVIKNLGPKKRISEEGMAEAWRGAVGGAASTHTRPVSFQKGILTVNVDGSCWLYELTLKKKELIKKLEGKL